MLTAVEEVDMSTIQTMLYMCDTYLPLMGVFRGVSVTVEEERDSEEVRISDDMQTL